MGLICLFGAGQRLSAQVVCTYTAPNDLCQNAITISNLNLSSSTCCGDIEGVSFCSTSETGVWYYYKQSGAASLISIENMSISGGISAEFYTGACDNLTLIQKSDCSGFMSRNFEIPNCNGNLFIHISSTKIGCGKFNISAIDLPGCNFADICEDVSAAQLLSPIADGVQVCTSSCLNYSCVSTCTDESVWFRFDTDNLTTTVQIVIKNSEFLPIISIYRGANCSDLDDLLLCQTVGLGEFVDLAVTPNFTYFIEISHGTGNLGTFDLCINAIQEYIECSSAALTVTRTENPLGKPNGPYCPGETVLFCYDLEFYVDTPDQGNGCQWLQGIVPVVGGGWDLNANNLETQNPLNWLWFDDVDYNVDSPVLSLGTDPQGKRILEYGPGGLKTGDILPGGWYFVSNGTNIGCTNDGHPNNMWGVNTPCGQIFNFSHCFELTAKSITDIQDCENEFDKNLSVTLFNFADGETGCYTSLACSGDTPVKFEAYLDCSSLVDIVATGKEICSGEFAEIPVMIDGDYEIPLIVEVIDAGNTSGAQDWIFETGSGLIPDQIINNGNSVETITYRVSFYEPITDCDIPELEFQVLVHPEFNISLPTLYELCEGEFQTLSAPAGHDAYSWYDAQSNVLLSNQREIVTDTSGYYRIEVVEDFCTATEIIQVIVNEPLQPALAISELRICNNYIGTLETFLNLEKYQLNGVEGDWFDDNSDLINDPSFLEFTGLTASTLQYEFQTTSAMPPCPDTTYFVEIIVEDCQCPYINIIAPLDFCALSQVFELNNINATIEPGSWYIVDGPVGANIQIIGTEMSVGPNTVEGLYSLMFSLDDPNLAPLCSRDSTVQFNVYKTPEAQIVASGNVCNEYTGTLLDYLDLDDLNLSNSSGVWESANSSLIIEADNLVSFTNQDAGDYTFYFTTANAQSPCQNRQYVTVIRVEDCSCPETTLLPIGDQCIDDISIDLNALELTSEEGVWSVVTGPDINSITIAGDQLSIEENSVEGDYTLRYTLSDNTISPLCDTYSEIAFKLSRPVSADITPQFELCNEFTGTLETSMDLDDLISTTNSGVWTSDLGSIVIDKDNIVDFAGENVSDYTFRFITNDAVFPCVNEEYVSVISIIDCSCPDISISPLDDQCIDDISIDLNALELTSEEGVWSVVSGPDINSITIAGDQLSIDENSVEGDYTLRYTLSSTTIGPLCDTYSEIAFKLSRPVSADITPQFKLCNEFTGTLETSIDLDDLISTTNTGVWTSDSGSIAIDQNNIVDFTNEAVGDYSFKFITNDAVLPCINKEYNTTVSVIDCRCPEVEFLTLDDQCIETKSIDLNNLRLSGPIGIWTIEAGPDINSLSINSGMLEIDDSSVAGEYTIRYTIDGNDIGPLCVLISEFNFNLFQEPEAVIVERGEACNEDTGTFADFIDLDDYYSSGSSGIWSSMDPGVQIDNSDNTVTFVTKEVREYRFLFTTDTASFPCEDQQYILDVDLLDCSCPSIELSPIGDLCLGEYSIDLSDYKITQELGDWSLESGPELTSLELIGSNLRIDDQTLSGLYTLRFDLAGNGIGPDCPISSFIDFRIVEPPFSDIVDQAVACNEDTGADPDFLNLDDYNKSNSIGLWSSVDQSILIDADNIVRFTGETPGTYDFIFTTETAIAPCVELSYPLTVNVKDCSCPSIVVNPPGDFCQEDQIFELNNLIVDADPGEWSLAVGMGSVPVLFGSQLIIEEESLAGQYLLSYTLLDQNIPPDCEYTIDMPFLIIEEPSAELTPSIELCNNFIGSLNTSIDLDDLWISGDGGEWISTSAQVSIDNDNIVEFEDLPSGQYRFFFRTNTAIFPCEDEEYLVLVDIMDCVCPNLQIENIPDLCSEEEGIDLSLYLQSDNPGFWTITPNPSGQYFDILNNELTISDNAQAGTYNLSYRFDDINIPSLCKFEEIIQFEIIGAPEIDVVNTFLACNDDDSGFAPVEIDLDDFVIGDEGEWRSLDTSVLIDNDGLVSFEALNAGEYSFEYMSSSAIFPCKNISDILIVTVENCECPIIAFAPTTVVCNEVELLDLDDYLLNGVSSGTWNQIDGPEVIVIGQGNDLNILGITGGEYTFEFSLSSIVPVGCNNKDLFSFEVVETLDLEVLPMANVCNQSSWLAPECIDLSAYVNDVPGEWQAPNNYTGDFSDVTKICFDGFQENDRFEFSYTSNSAISPCEDKTAILEVIVMECSCPFLEVDEPGPFCNSNQIVNLQDYVSSESVEGIWSFISGPSVIGLNEESFSVLDLTEGLYAFMYTPLVKPPDSCPQNISIEFEIKENRAVGSGTSLNYCEGEDQLLDLFSLLQSADIGGEWLDNSTISAGSSFDPTDASLLIAELTPGIYNFDYLMTPDEPCSPSSARINIIISEIPIADAGEDFALICDKPEGNLGGPDMSIGSNLIFTWTELNTMTILSTMEQNPLIDVAGLYQLEILNQVSGCISVDEILVTDEIDELYFEAEVLEFECSNPNEGMITIINSSGGDQNYSYSIDGGNSWTQDNYFDNLSPGNYTIVMQDGNLCETIVENLIISAPISLNVFAGEDLEVDYGDEYFILELSTNAQDDEIVSIIWEQDGEIICDGGIDDCYTIEVDPYKINELCVSVEDVSGCLDTDCMIIEEILEVNVYIPNVFRPLSYTINDMFFVQTNENVSTINTFRVLDRWGGIVFERTDKHEPNIADEGWDGTWLQRDVMPGVFTYHIVVEDVFGELHSFAGDITLLR